MLTVHFDLTDFCLWNFIMSRTYFENKFVSQEFDTSVKELNTIIIFVFQELKVRILRICRARLLLYLAKKKSPAKSEPLKRSNRISIARNEILSRRYVASSRAYYQRMTKIPEI